jgi:hypothetical protein
MWLCWRLLLLRLLLLLLGVLLGLGGLLGRVRKLACRHGMRIVSVHMCLEEEQWGWGGGRERFERSLGRDTRRKRRGGTGRDR